MMVRQGGNVTSLGKLDGFDMWRYLSQGSNSPRVEMLYNYDKWIFNAQGLRFSKYKLVLDDSGMFNQRYPTAGGQASEPSWNFPWHWRDRATVKCDRRVPENFSDNDTVFLFDIVADPCERNNLADSLPVVVEFLRKRIEAYAAIAVPPLNAPKDPAGFPELHNGTWAPWLDSVL
ncbi:hypothetical protein MRX96_027127 [Rhipicephalus microplus]